MKNNLNKSGINQFKNHSFNNLNIIFGGTGDSNGDDDDTERKGIKIPTNGHGNSEEGDGN